MSDLTDTLRARVEQAQALAAAATPGPWHVSELDTVAPCVSSAHYPLLHVHGDDDGRPWVDDYTPADPQPMADADLIAAAPDLVALVTDLWAAYATRAQDASVAVARACLERDEARRSLAVAQADLAVARAVDAEHLQRAVRAEQERDAALATVARHRGEAKTPVVAGGRELVWVGVSDGTWHLCWVDDRRWATAPYSAWRRDAVSYACFGAPRAATVQCNDIRAAVCELARMARADGRTVPPHPEGWDVGVSNG